MFGNWLKTLLQKMIMNPVSAGSLAGLFSTHPDTGERVVRLNAMARA